MIAKTHVRLWMLLEPPRSSLFRHSRRQAASRGPRISARKVEVVVISEMPGRVGLNESLRRARPRKLPNSALAGLPQASICD